MSRINLDISKDTRNNEYILKGFDSLDLDSTLYCGQAFRWKKSGNINVACVRNELLALEQRDDQIILHEANDSKLDIVISYLKLETSHSEIEEELVGTDDIMKKAVAYSKGLRLVNQEPFECLISYIISANNSIPLITRAIDNISRKWGTAKKFGENIYYTFPSANDLKDASEEELFSCKTGFRAAYLKNAILRVNSKDMDLTKIKCLAYKEAKEALLKQKGVGEKVADCVLLFSMEKYEAFPVDIWIDRIVRHLYMNKEPVSKKKVREWGESYFGALAGYAQEYLFAYARECIPELLRK